MSERFKVVFIMQGAIQVFGFTFYLYMINYQHVTFALQRH